MSHHRTYHRSNYIKPDLEFKCLLRTFYTFYQVKHHLKNWDKCPSSLNKRVDSVISNVCLPAPNTTLKNRLKNLTAQICDELQDTARIHLDFSLSDIVNTLGTKVINLDHKKVCSALIISKKWIKRAYRTFRPDVFNCLLNELLRVNPKFIFTLEDDRIIDSSPNDDQEPLNMTSVSSSYSPIGDDSTESGISPLMETFMEAQPFSQQRKKMDKRKRESTSPISNSSSPPLVVPKRAHLNTASSPIDPLLDTSVGIELGSQSEPQNIQTVPISTQTVLNTLEASNASTDNTSNDSTISTDSNIPLADLQPQHGILHDHTNTPKPNRKIPHVLENQVLVLGTSNIKRIPVSQLPPSWVANSFPGATLRNLINLVLAYDGKTPSKVVISIGVNDKDLSEQCIKQNLILLYNACRDIFGTKRTFYVINNVSSLLTDTQKSRLYMLNGVLSEYPQTIKPIDRELFKVNRTDKVHWTRETAIHIISGWVSHLNYMP